jgi:hypothetical protein
VGWTTEGVGAAAKKGFNGTAAGRLEATEELASELFFGAVAGTTIGLAAAFPLAIPDAEEPPLPTALPELPPGGADCARGACDCDLVAKNAILIASDESATGTVSATAAAGGEATAS